MKATERWDRDDARIGLIRGWADASAAEAWMQHLDLELAWKEETLVLYGRPVRVPREVAWYGDPHCHYRYSGRDHAPRPWHPLLAEIRDRINGEWDIGINCVLANRYRHGDDAMGWHSDDEPELGPEPVVVSLSLGATRRIRFRHKQRRAPGFGIDLGQGDLLVMSGTTQSDWQHCLTRTRRPVGPRINLTFRRRVPPSDGTVVH